MNNQDPIICIGCKEPIEKCICHALQQFKNGNNGSGYLVTTQKGLKGRTYHDKGLVNDKVLVYIGENKLPMLCRPETLEVNGFID